MQKAHLASLILLSAAGCGGAPPPARPEVARPAAAAEAPIVLRPAARKEEPLHVRDVGFQTPESALYDAESDLYLVSNIDGSPLEADDRAFISRVRPDGSVENLSWIDAQDPEVNLDAPKGMALVGDVLYVADISAVRKFDRRSGKPLGSVHIEGATFVNDVCADPEGNLYVSDSGIARGFVPSGGDAVYKLDAQGHVSVLAKSASLGRPNGLAFGPGGLWVATFGSGELYALGAQGEVQQRQKLPKGSLDGIVRWQERLFVSSWEASAVYEREGDRFVERVSGLGAPSDIGFDDKRKRLLIPLFYADELVIYPL